MDDLRTRVEQSIDFRVHMRPALRSALAEASGSRPPLLRYGIDRAQLPPALAACVTVLHTDEAARRFIDEAGSQGALAQMVKSGLATLLHICLNLTDLNAWLRRGEMFVLSTTQARALMGGPFQRLLDVGAGDGAVTQQLAPLARDVICTEVSPPMAARLRERGWPCVLAELPAAGFRFDAISCLNVLCRAKRPLTLLRRLRDMLAPGGVLLIGVVVPWQPAVLGRVGVTLPPSEALPAAVCDAGSFEECASALVEQLFEPLGFVVRVLTRVPYLSRDGPNGSIMELDDALFTLTVREGFAA